MSKLKELTENGCCVLEQVLPEKLTQKCIDISNKALEKLSNEHRERNKSQGSMIHLADYPEYSDLIASPELMKSLENNFNFSDLRFRFDNIKMMKNYINLFEHFFNFFLQDLNSFIFFNGKKDCIFGEKILI